MTIDDAAVIVVGDYNVEWDTLRLLTDKPCVSYYARYGFEPWRKPWRKTESSDKDKVVCSIENQVEFAKQSRAYLNKTNNSDAWSSLLQEFRQIHFGLPSEAPKHFCAVY